MLEFVMIAKAANRGRYDRDIVPWIIDYFLPDSDTDAFLKSTSVCPLVLISSREAYERLVSHGADRKRYRHMPLSLPDRYRPDHNAYKDKDIDIALIGRVSSILLDYAKRYVTEHPGLKVVTSGPKRDGHHWVYDSAGNPVADVSGREEYMALLRRSRLFLYSTPGIDDGKPTNGFSQVTPRFLEAIACGCRPLMRYPDNPDTRYFRLADFGPSIETYDDFSTAAERAFSSTADNRIYDDYLAKRYTSAVIKSIADYN